MIYNLGLYLGLYYNEGSDANEQLHMVVSPASLGWSVMPKHTTTCRLLDSNPNVLVKLLTLYQLNYVANPSSSNDQRFHVHTSAPGLANFNFWQ